jgi:hypothetical protein
VDWVLFGLGVVAVVIVGMVLWRRWRRWNPVSGNSDESKAAEARLWSTKVMDQR